ncbi:MAG TPA: tRNA adenosine(34) deaminase TadA [Tepidisphaeraceae bacterium]|nr:tRNA adenosine(34) deaminase TadA [Tepidisphaeraceae bacterium]
MNLATDEQWMREALTEARRAGDAGEVPIGCVIVHEPTNRIIGRGYNRRETDEDPTAHAEIVAMRQAGQSLGHWRLLECALIVTLEPCPMCAGAIVNARIPRLIYGCPDPKAGAVRTLFQLCEDPRLNHRVAVTAGVLSEECAALLTDFFRAQRLMGKR